MKTLEWKRCSDNCWAAEVDGVEAGILTISVHASMATGADEQWYWHSNLHHADREGDLTGYCDLLDAKLWVRRWLRDGGDL